MNQSKDWDEANRIKKQFSLAKETDEIIVRSSDVNHKKQGRMLDIIVQEWLSLRQHKIKELTIQRTKVDSIDERLNKIDARLSWIEGLLADAEITIVKSDKD